MTSKLLVRELSHVLEMISSFRAEVSDGVGSLALEWVKEKSDAADQSMIDAIESVERQLGEPIWGLRDAGHTVQARREKAISAADMIMNDAVDALDHVEQVIINLKSAVEGQAHD